MSVRPDQLRLVTLVGNPRPASRTLMVAEEVARQLAGALESGGGAVHQETIDLIELAGDLFVADSPRLLAARARVTEARVLVVASPTYKASFTGVLKSFLDHFPAPSLAGKLAFPVMTGGSLKHALAVEVHLRPVLVELGASCPASGLYVLEAEFEDVTAVVSRWLEGVRASADVRFREPTRTQAV